MRPVTAHVGQKLYIALLVTTFLLLVAAPVRFVDAGPPFQMTPGGMQYKELVRGEGEPAQLGQVVHIHLVGWIAEQGARGKELFNSRRDKGVISYVLGTEKVMPAFNEGVIGMKSGARRLLMVPPVFAYGERGVDGAVPPDTGLILLIALLKIESN